MTSSSLLGAKVAAPQLGRGMFAEEFPSNLMRSRSTILRKPKRLKKDVRPTFANRNPMVSSGYQSGMHPA